MKFLPVHSFENPSAQKIYRAYTTTFPADERRNDEQFKALFEHPNAFVNSILWREAEVGYLVLWKLSESIFVEHFEVFEEFRNQKLGSVVVKTLIEEHSNIILESEPSYLSDIAERRIGFYQKNSLSIINESYIQPSYEEGKNPLELFLMASWLPEDIQAVEQEIHRTVYGVEV